MTDREREIRARLEYLIDKPVFTKEDYEEAMQLIEELERED